MIIALHSVLHESAETGYERDHRTIPADRAEVSMRIGIRDWLIERSGRRPLHLVDCEDWLAANEALQDELANLAWQSHIGRHIAPFVSQEGGPAGQVRPPSTVRRPVMSARRTQCHRLRQPRCR